MLPAANPSPKEKPATKVTDFSVNLVLNQFQSPPQQCSRSKDQDAAEDREEPCAGATGGGKGDAGGVANNDCHFPINKFQQIVGIIEYCDNQFI